MLNTFWVLKIYIPSGCTTCPEWLSYSILGVATNKCVSVCRIRRTINRTSWGWWLAFENIQFPRNISGSILVFDLLQNEILKYLYATLLYLLRISLVKVKRKRAIQNKIHHG